jgi:2-keto-4-pentenoate hydratase/2-oxohepta-3-ene-1,7-dioic acid hydratase in catechol pathway
LRFVNRKGRLALDLEDRAVDVESRSSGRFASDPMAAFADWSSLLDWATHQQPEPGDPGIDPSELGPPVPRPTQVFAIGLNYRDHAEEAGLPIPEAPMVFTKFPTCMVGPRAQVPLTSNRVDWEVELVVVMCREASGVAASEAWDHVAGLCVGQDISDRRLQFAGRPPQFSLGKSAAAFGPIGPALVSRDAFVDPDRLALRCWVDDELVQDSTTENLIFPVPELIEYISRYCPLQPGDLIFTGTPAGVGSVREPRRYLVAGETIVSEIEGIGRLSNPCVEPDRMSASEHA